jgi:tetratricopeptide (TPR) repeat protein
LRGLNRPDQALDSYDRALTIKPDYAEALNHRGIALFDLKRSEQALYNYDRALTIKPDYAEAFNNRGNTLRAQKRHEQALESYDRAIRIKPDYAEAHWNESLCRLLLGEFTLGWQKYEWRWKKEPLLNSLKNFKQALWLGKEELNYKTILLHSEQGLGDTIQFCRYAALVAELGAKVILEVPPPLKSLIKNLEGVTAVLAHI